MSETKHECPLDCLFRSKSSDIQAGLVELKNLIKIQTITVGLLDTFFNIDNNNEWFFSTKSAY